MPPPRNIPISAQGTTQCGPQNMQYARTRTYVAEKSCKTGGWALSPKMVNTIRYVLMQYVHKICHCISPPHVMKHGGGTQPEKCTSLASNPGQQEQQAGQLTHRHHASCLICISARYFKCTDGRPKTNLCKDLMGHDGPGLEGQQQRRNRFSKRASGEAPARLWGGSGGNS